jgi:hypothetical protein
MRENFSCLMMNPWILFCHNMVISHVTEISVLFCIGILVVTDISHERNFLLSHAGVGRTPILILENEGLIVGKRLFQRKSGGSRMSDSSRPLCDVEENREGREPFISNRLVGTDGRLDSF